MRATVPDLILSPGVLLVLSFPNVFCFLPEFKASCFFHGQLAERALSVELVKGELLFLIFICVCVVVVVFSWGGGGGQYF